MIEEIKKTLESANQGKWAWGRKTIKADEDGDIYLGDSLTRWTLNSRGNLVGNMILRIEQNEHGINEIVGFNAQDAHLIANAPEWLRYLLSEVERTGEINKTIAKGALKAAEDVLTLHAQVEELQKALEWYADAGNYFATSLGKVSESDIDSGERARQALERTKP